MKTLFIFFTAVIISTSAFAQKTIDGVLGVKFGSSTATVKSIIKERGGTLKSDLKENELRYSGLFFGGRKAFDVTFQFTDDKLFQALIFIIPDKDPQVFEIYAGILKDLETDYGTSTPQRSYKYPYDKDDKENLTALKGGYITMNDLWYSGENAIRLKISDSILITVQYQDGKLFNDSRKGKKPLDDY